MARLHDAEERSNTDIQADNQPKKNYTAKDTTKEKAEFQVL